MPVNDKDMMENRVLETANRLRLIQADFADESDQTRRDYLCEEIEKVLATILPTERSEFLRKLLERFPTGNFAAKSAEGKSEGERGSMGGESRLKNVDFLIQNLLEIIPTLSEEQRVIIDKSLQEVGWGLQKRLGCDAVLITRGEFGMTLYESSGRESHFPAVAKKVFDVTGAGDTVVSVLCVALAAGAKIDGAAFLANHAAGVVVGELGTASVTRTQLGEALEG